MRCLLCCRQFFLFGLCSLLFSCSRFSVHEDIRFTLPESSSWKVFSSCCEPFVFNGNDFVLSVVKNEPTAVIVRSEISSVEFGAIYPFDSELSEFHVFPAQVLYSLILSSVNSEEEKMYCLSTFNWKRFEEDCEVLGENIWKVNKESVMRKIAKGTFRKSDLKIEKSR